MGNQEGFLRDFSPIDIGIRVPRVVFNPCSSGVREPARVEDDPWHHQSGITYFIKYVNINLRLCRVGAAHRPGIGGRCPPYKTSGQTASTARRAKRTHWSSRVDDVHHCSIARASLREGDGRGGGGVDAGGRPTVRDRERPGFAVPVSLFPVFFRSGHFPPKLSKRLTQ
jgi:hypothetical protein